MPEQLTCEVCDGGGRISGIGHGPEGSQWVDMECFLCKGAGEMSWQQADWRRRGRRLKERRGELGYGMRQFAEHVNVAPAMIAYMESGRMEPNESLYGLEAPND